jgi:Immunity protein Imm1
MGIEQLTICDWARQPRDLEIWNPQWPQIEVAIRALNNQNLNDIYLTPSRDTPGTYLSVGGGAGRYLVTGAIGIDEKFPMLVDEHSDDESLRPLVVGGQGGEFPARWLVSLEAALSAAHAFFESGGFDCDVRWVYPEV